MEKITSRYSLKPIKSNQWYSNILAKFPTQPIFAYPIAYKLSESGISFSYPDIKASKNTIQSPFTEDFTIKANSFFEKPIVEAIGDWNVFIRLENKNEFFNFNLVKGAPHTTVKTNSKEVSLDFPNKFEVFNNNSLEAQKIGEFEASSFLIVTRDHNYIISFSEPKLFSLSDKKLLIKNPNSIFIGLLDNRSNYQIFKEIAGSQIIDTSFSFDFRDDILSTRYSIDSAKGSTLITIFPHQLPLINDKSTEIGEYQTIRGPLKLVKTTSFETNIPIRKPTDSYPKLTKDYPDLLKQLEIDSKKLMTEKMPASKDYYLGKWFGEASSLILLADSLGQTELRDQLIEFVKPKFIESLDYFEYNPILTSLIAKNPEFGNEKLNDHHFHYGYFIRTAAVLARFDPSIVSEVQPQIDLMSRDIANIKRDSNEFPFLRHFDIYEGHSWADGYGDFSDGNNQESTSEAINAWYGIYLWSGVTKNPELEKYALYLYATEIESTLTYWFDNQDIYKTPFEHEIASIVWGGKIDFTTWFSSQTNMIYGIQLLPFTPASDYLAKITDFKKYDADIKSNSGGETKEWGDLYLIWRSFYEPTEAFNLKNKVGKKEESTSRSLFLYYLYKNSENR